MAADVAEKKESLNPCCQLWRDKYLNCHEKRNALRQAVKFLEPKISMFQAENLGLKKACEEERARAEIEEEGRKKESAARVLLENEVSALKSELSLLQQKVGSHAQSVGDVKLLAIRISEGEKEIEHLKEVLEKEKIRADSEKKHAEVEKKNATEAWKCVESEKGRANEERRLLNIEVKKAEKYRIQLEVSCKELASAKSRLVSEASKLEEAKKNLEAEKLKVCKERKRADLEMAKVEEQRKLAEASRKQAEDEKCHTENFSRQLEEARLKIVELQKEIQDIVSRYTGKTNTAIPSYEYLSRDSEKVKLLKKQLKFEKMKVKHAKQVAKWEKSRNSFLQQELVHLKRDFVQFLHHLDVVDKCFLPNAEGIDHLGREKVMDYSNLQILKSKEKLYAAEPFQMYLESRNELPKPCCMDVATAHPVRQTVQHVAPSLSLSGGMCSESISGTDSKDSKLESLLGGSCRKMLQSCAINSSSTSVSDRQLMGSQGRGTTSSKLIEESLNAQATNSLISGEVNRMKCNRKLALDAENSIRSPRRIGGTGKTNGPNRNRNRIINVMESIEFLHSQDRKLHSQIEEKLSDLYIELNKQVNKSLEEGNYSVPNLHDDLYAKHERVPKKRKASHKENLGIQHFCDGGEHKRIKHVNSKVHEDARTFQQTSGPPNDLIGDEGIGGSVISHLETLSNFEEVAIGDYMKLLDLDNPVDEECYRTAMEMPLSPTLPEIEFQAVETFVSDKFEPLVEEKFYGGLSKEKENMVPSCGYDVINAEIISNEFNNNASKNSHNSLLYENEGPLDSCDAKINSGDIFCSAMQAEKACDNQALDFEVEGAVSNLSGDEVAKFPFESELGPAHDNIPKHFVVFHNIKDKNSMSRILHATKICMDRCCLVAQTDWILQNILLALRMEEHLLSEEKACVFFSLLLLNFSTAARGKSMTSLNSDIFQCLDSFVSSVAAVMSDAEARSVFDKLCLDELLSFIEDFLMDGKILMCTDISSETLNECDSKINILLDGVNVSLSAEAASAAQLMAGSIILASISVATDRIGFICEASYNIFRMRLCDPSLVLTVLHIFAYLGGEKIFTSRKYNLTMTVLKSIVMSLERQCLSFAADSSVSSANEIQAKFRPCAECPFSKDEVSLEIVISLLLEKLKSYAELPDFQSNSIVETTLCHATDVLSLVELLAFIMRWDWTCTTVVPELLRLLESPIAESFALAIVILLGQLGRLGVDTCGYEDKNVRILRNRLSAFLSLETTSRACLPLQIATVTALLGLLTLDFEQVIQINSTSPSTANQSVPADSIRKWFSSLSHKHQALSLTLLQSSALVPKLRNSFPGNSDCE